MNFVKNSYFFSKSLISDNSSLSDGLTGSGGKTSSLRLKALTPFTSRNITKATIMKSIVCVKNCPHNNTDPPSTTPSLFIDPSEITYFKSFKSALKTNPISGETIPPVKL